MLSKRALQLLRHMLSLLQSLLLLKIPAVVQTVLLPLLLLLRGCLGVVLSGRARELCQLILLLLQMRPLPRTMLLSQAALLVQLLR